MIGGARVHRDATHCADFGKLVVLTEEPEDLLVSLGGGSHLCYSWVVSLATTFVFVYTLPILLTDYTSSIVTTKLVSTHQVLSKIITCYRTSGSDSPCSLQFRLAKL